MSPEAEALPRIAFEFQAGASLAATGIGQYARSLLAALRQASPDLDIEALVPSRHDEVRWTTPRRVLWDQLGAPRRARASGAQILHTPGFSPAYFTDRVRVHSLHDLIGLERPDLVRGRGARWYWGHHLPRCVRRCQQVIASSEHTARLARDRLGIATSRLDVVPLAPVVRGGLPKDRRPPEGWPRRYVLAIGSHEPRKDHALLVRAYAALPASLQESVRLVLVGPDGGDRDRVRAAVRECRVEEHVHWVGYLPDEELHRALVAAEVFAFPSRAEGFGLPPLEAMAAGVPVVALAAGAVPEVSGEGAWLVPEPFSIEAFSEALRTLLDSADERSRWISAGSRRVARYSWATTAEQTIECYRKAWRSRETAP